MSGQPVKIENVKRAIPVTQADLALLDRIVAVGRSCDVFSPELLDEIARLRDRMDGK